MEERRIVICCYHVKVGLAKMACLPPLLIADIGYIDGNDKIAALTKYNVAVSANGINSVQIESKYLARGQSPQVYLS